MTCIPPDKPFEQPPLVKKTEPSLIDSKISEVAQVRFTPTDSTRSTAPLDITNSDRSKTTETTDRFATSILGPRSIEQLRKLAIVMPNPRKSLRRLDTVSFLQTLEPPLPSRKVFQGIIKQIKNVYTLLEIWNELIKKPEDDSLEDLLVDVFQAISAKNRDSSFTAYTKTGQRLKIKKRIADCINPEDYEFFLDKAIDKNAHFSIVLFFKKFYEKNVSEGNKVDLYSKFTSTSLGDRICLQLSFLMKVYPTRFDTLTFGDFQKLYVDFFEAGWGKKEEFLTKALCCFWNAITSSNRGELKIGQEVWIQRYLVSMDLENLENGILDIGESYDPNLISENKPLFVLLFFVGILYPTIQEKIRANKTSPFLLKPEDLERDYANLAPNSKKFIDKICTLLLPPEEAIKNLEEVDPLDPESFPCIRAKHPQFSGSCVVKNFNSLLSMSSLAPSIIIEGGYKGHAVYAEIFKSDDKYYALVHNLGAGYDIHQVDHGNKMKPLALFFDKKEHLIEFSKIFCKENTTEREYRDLVTRYMFKVTDPESASPFVRSLSFIESHRENPMHSKYREFRGLQREIIRKLIDHTGSPSEVKATASAKRKWQKEAIRKWQKEQ